MRFPPLRVCCMTSHIGRGTLARHPTNMKLTKQVCQACLESGGHITLFCTPEEPGAREALALDLGTTWPR